jgi:hypothetical protein
VSDSTHPSLIKNYASAQGYEVILAGTTAYVAARHDGLLILNCSNLSTGPTIYSRVNNASSNITYGLAIAGNYAYITQLYLGMYIIDITNRSAPVTCGFYSRGTSPAYKDISVVGSLAYIANAAYGLDIVDVSNPMHPVLLSTYDPTPNVNSVTVKGSVAFLSTDGGLITLDCSNSSSPVFAFQWDDGAGIGAKIGEMNSVLFMADSAYGVRILDSGCDYDQDGLSDWKETHVYNTDLARADTDNDGLLDGAEISRGTDPTNPDTDGDGLLDGAEVARGTNPLVADTDGDGLLDGAEVARGTNPLIADTDGDGYSDKQEVDAGTDPLDPASYPGSTTQAPASSDWVIWVVVGAAGGAAAVVIGFIFLKKRKVTRA